MPERVEHDDRERIAEETTAAGCDPSVVDQRVGAVDTSADALAGGNSLERLVLLSDVDGLHREISIPGDVLVHAGDFCSEDEAVEARWFGEFFRGLPPRHKMVIAGNHTGLASHEEMQGRNSVHALT